MSNDVQYVTILKKDGSTVLTDTDKLPDDNELAIETDLLNKAIGIVVKGKVVKKEL